MVAPDEVQRLKAELAEWEQRRQRAEAALGRPRLRDRNKFVSVLLHGDLNTLDRVADLRQEFRLCDDKVARIRNRLSALGDTGTTPRREEVPRHAADRQSLVAKVARDKKARRSADKLLRSIRTAQRQIGRASRHHVRDDDSRSMVDRDAKKVSKRIRKVRRRVATLRSMSRDLVDIDGLDGLDGKFSGSRVDHKARSQEYDDARRALDALAKAVTPLRDKLELAEKKAKAELSRHDKKIR